MRILANDEADDFTDEIGTGAEYSPLARPVPYSAPNKQPGAGNQESSGRQDQ